MATSNEEKYLKSIDGTLKDILKELKRQNRVEILTEKGKVDAEATAINRIIRNAGAIRD